MDTTVGFAVNNLGVALHTLRANAAWRAKLDGTRWWIRTTSTGSRRAIGPEAELLDVAEKIIASQQCAV